MEVRPPIQTGDLARLADLLLESLNEKQLLILSEIGSSAATISALVEAISFEQGIPRSTLKSNVKRLRELGLVDCGGGLPAKLTDTGELVMRILKPNEVL